MDLYYNSPQPEQAVIESILNSAFTQANSSDAASLTDVGWTFFPSYLGGFAAPSRMRRSVESVAPPNSSIFHRTEFLDPEISGHLLDQMKSTVALPAKVDLNGQIHIDSDRRRALSPELSSDSRDELVERLRELAPTLCSHFETSLGEVERPEALIYGPGDFFCFHRDEELGPPDRRRRILSAIVFLNDWTPQSDSAQGFGGGIFKLYPEARGRRTRGPCVPIPSKAGKLIVFPSEMYHEVSAVTHGNRYALVAHFLHPKFGRSNCAV